MSHEGWKPSGSGRTPRFTLKTGELELRVEHFDFGWGPQKWVAWVNDKDTSLDGRGESRAVAVAQLQVSIKGRIKQLQEALKALEENP